PPPPPVEPEPTPPPVQHEAPPPPADEDEDDVLVLDSSMVATDEPAAKEPETEAATAEKPEPVEDAAPPAKEEPSPVPEVKEEPANETQELIPVAEQPSPVPAAPLPTESKEEAPSASPSPLPEPEKAPVPGDAALAAWKGSMGNLKTQTARIRMSEDRNEIDASAYTGASEGDAPTPVQIALDKQTVGATEHSFGALQQMLRRKQAVEHKERRVAITRGGNLTIEDIVRDEVRAFLKEWLDQHLSGIVQQAVQKEIERLSDR
ncbi:DUF2497 domain-containing protein, partial [Acetobacter sp.]|uniref:DUF2497 domain-containing protein n=1 Tax=Acetobacter sp. TaxID=440 RepID=UPI0039EC8BAE